MKIICIGRNYVEHAKELGNSVPTEPVIFMKPHNALYCFNKPFYYPQFTNELHYECELVIKICKNGKHISLQNANQYYDQVTLGIDFTARDIQNQLKEKGLPWEKAKAFDDSAIVGKWKKFTPEMKDSPINFHFDVNSETKQVGSTTNMIFSIDILLVEISKYFSVNIGDLIFTGTPAGVGECVSGDTLEAFFENESLLKLNVK